ncbi:flagellar hook-associated protein 2 [Bacillus sp. FJAT-44742]|uniref:flagellar hook-associated protein 2 n=1 Tax=Bacillus sp. FJAT-44742 TaxID=2014005 RepID=UPI000C2312AD|nr:flagellar hook-associated protein 2 [Bacillus sp. FJAT-44742]
MSDMRMTGFASGMDINQMVSDLMRAEREPLNRMEQDRQLLLWQQEAYREVNRQFADFRTTTFDGIMRRANMTATTVSSTDESKVTASGSASSGEGSYTLSRVDRLASAASNVSSDEILGSEGRLDGDASLWSQLSTHEGMNWETKEHQETIQVNADSGIAVLESGAIDPASVEVPGFSVVTSEEELNEGSVLVDDETGTLQFHDSFEGGESLEVTYQSHVFSFDATTYDSEGEEVTETFEFAGTDSLQQVLGDINRSSLGVNAFYDEFSGRVALARSDTGQYNEAREGDEARTAENAEIKFSDGFLRDVLHLDESNESGGDNAQFTINGLETERTSNSFTIDGVNITLHDTLTERPVMLGVSTDTEQVFDQVIEFVDEYNALIELVDGKVSEERYRDYQPLTDEQRREMSEREQEMWDERAESGMLRNDRMFSGALDQMRQDMYGSVDTDQGTFSHLTELGITTTSNYQDRGRLEVDEEKLREAIAQDAEGVFQIFAANGDSYEEKGAARRLRETLQGTIKQVSQRAGGASAASNQQFTIGREIDQMNDRMTNFERRMQQTEQRYWAQFTRMEQAMAQANAQMEQLMSQMGGMGM